MKDNQYITAMIITILYSIYHEVLELVDQVQEDEGGAAERGRGTKMAARRGMVGRRGRGEQHPGS